jgi:uncharacterized repeat protein (TIGR03803 family)
MNLSSLAKLGWILCLFLIAAATAAPAQTETILHSFTCAITDGCAPYAGVTLDSSDNIYGTTTAGGANGLGTVFKLTPSGQFSLLHSFSATTTDGYEPYAAVTLNSAGNIYGTTYVGGLDGFGTVFEITPTGAESLLYSFTCGADGCYPQSVLALDKSGNLYGTTTYGGTYGWGTVFKISPSGVFSTLYGFTGGADGGSPGTNLVLDSADNLYGVTSVGGAYTFGTVFKITPTGTESVLYSFNANGKDGFYPFYGVVDSQGELYGGAGRGGSTGVGAIFEVNSATGTESILHSFKAGTDGIFPAGVPVLTAKGLYGASHYGGTFDLGTIFQINTSGVETILHNFASNGIDGYFPLSGLAADSSGNLYGTTTQGGSTACEGGCGVVFKLVP